MKKSMRPVQNLRPAIVCGAALMFFCHLLLAAERAGQALGVKEILLNNCTAVRAAGLGDTIENLEKVLSIAEAGNLLVARYRATSDGHMRIDVFGGDTRVYSEGKDDEGVWEWPGDKDGPEDVYHEGVGALEHGIEFNIFCLAELPARGHDVKLAGREIIRGTDYFVLKITLADGFETFRYVNPETWRVDLSRDFRAFHPGLDSTRKNLETRFDQWEQVDGVVYASRSQNVDLESGEVIATTLVLVSRYNLAPHELELARSYVPAGAPAAGRKIAGSTAVPLR